MDKLTDLFIDGLSAKSQIIPERVINMAKKCLLDYLGVAVGGARYMYKLHPDLFESLAKENGNSTVLGTNFKTTPSNAAFLNGFSAHVLELDDGHRKGMIHLGASIISSVLSVAEQEKLSFDDLLRGIVIGYDAAVRCACALQPDHKVRGYHVSGTCGTIGSAISVAIACGFSRSQIKCTLSCAATNAAGLLEIQENASELKPYNLGRAAMDGLVAAQIGYLDLNAPDDVIGGKRGFLSVLTDTPNSSYLTDFSKVDYCIEGIYQKLYAACRHCHPAIEASISIRNDYFITPEQIERVEVHTYKLAVEGHDHTQILGVSSAKLSIPYCVAMGVVKGNVGYEDFNEVNLNDPVISDLTKKVFVLEDAWFSAQSPSVRGAFVQIYTNDGEKYEKTVFYPKGEPENPISYEDIFQKTVSLFQGYNNNFANSILNKL